MLYLKEMYQNLQHAKIAVKVRGRKQLSESQWKRHMCTGCSFSLFLSLNFIMPLFTAIVVSQQTILKRVSAPEQKTLGQACSFRLNSTFPDSGEQ